jgi:hypothetical protein
MTTLTPDQVRGALALLNEKLLSRETQGELCLFGGAVMALVFDARPSTRDVDAIMVPKAELLEASAEVALEMGLREDWLNDGVKGFVSSQPELTADGLPMFSNLRLYRPTAAYLLAMKCLAARVEMTDHSGDRGDVMVLCRHLGLRSASEVFDIIERFYPGNRVPVKTQYFVTEIMEEIAAS